MSEEEKKAFESVKDMFEDVTIKDIDEQSITIYGVAMLDVIKVLTIIEKQQKELEQEKEKNKELDEKLKMSIAMLTKGTYPETEKGANDFDNYFISKDKIRAKIEEIMNYTYSSEEERDKQEYAYDRLKELLEEE